MSNSDNLGAVLDPRILAWIAAEGLPYVCEVTERTPADKKGGHIAMLKETGGLILRETAQTPDEDMDAFTDVERHPYFHVNNLWVDLRALDALLRERDGVMGLPMIVNEKTVDPSDASLARPSTSSRRRWARRSACSRARGRSGCRARASCRSRRRPTCWCCAPTPTCSATARGSSSRRGARAAPLVELDDDHFKLLGRLRRPLPGGRAVAGGAPSGSRSRAT